MSKLVRTLAKGGGTPAGGLSNPVDKLWWFRFALAIVAAALTSYLALYGGLSALDGFMLAILIYLGSFYIAKYGMKIKPETLPKRRDLVLTGIFAYFAAWFVFEILFFTLAKFFTGL